MNRREFLKVLAATGGAALAAAIPLESLPEELPAALPPLATTPAGGRRILLLREFHAHGLGMEGCHAIIRVSRAATAARPPVVLMEWSIDAGGGLLHWSANPSLDNTVVFLDGELPVIECSHPDVAWRTTLYDPDDSSAEILGYERSGRYAWRVQLPTARVRGPSDGWTDGTDEDGEYADHYGRAYDDADEVDAWNETEGWGDDEEDCDDEEALI